MATNENFDLDLQDEDAEDFVVDFGEVTDTGGGGTSNFNDLSNRPKYDNQLMTGETNIPKVPSKTSDLTNDSDYQTGTEVTNAITGAVDAEATARQNADNNLQGQIDAISASSDVTDIVGTYAELEDYDTSTLKDNDIIKVLQDESQNGETTYYRWNTSSESFTLIGEEGPYYTKSQTDSLLNDKQDTLTAGENITIENNVISAIGGGGVKTLTADDYNYPTDNPNTVALWLLDDGLYMLPGAGSTVSVTGALSGARVSDFNYMFNERIAHYVFKFNRYFWVVKDASSASSFLGNVSSVFMCNINSNGNFYFDKANQNLIFDKLYDNLTTTTAGNGALDANQGRVLKELIDSLVITGTGAPTTSTTGTVGQLYEDTTNGKLYQCTAVSGGTYTWEEVGAGGGGSITPVQTTGTSTTDVMSQDATTHMVYSEANPSTYAQGGAIYLGNLDANQVQQADPATANRGWKYFWALPSSNTSKPINNSICILGDIPNQTTGVAIGSTVALGCKVLGSNGVAIGPDAEATQQSVAIGFMANASRDNTNNGAVIAIGSAAQATADKAICIGGGGSSYGIQNSASTFSVALGYKAGIGNGANGYKNSVALGAYSEATRQGEVNVGLVKGETTGGYNDTAYRVIGGVHDGVDAHDVVTVEQLNATIDAINTATGSSIPHVGA